MRINKFIALHTRQSRRSADRLIAQARVTCNGKPAEAGQSAGPKDVIAIDGRPVDIRPKIQTIMLHKPAGYVVSRNGQGSHTIYELLPPELHHLKPAGRLDKDSSGLLILTNDGILAQQLTHPRYNKQKRYEITLETPLQPLHRQMITDYGISLADGISTFMLERPATQDDAETNWVVTMSEGRNRQIRRTFAALGYRVLRLHRTHFGPYHLGSLIHGRYQKIPPQP